MSALARLRESAQGFSDDEEDLLDAPSPSSKMEISGKPGSLSFVEEDTVGIQSPVRERDLDECIANSWHLNFDLERYFRKSYEFVTSKHNLQVFLLAGFLWSFLLFSMEYAFLKISGNFSVANTHILGTSGLSYISTGFKIQDGAIHGQLLHVLVVYAHRVLIFYPIMGSFYYAIFNGMRDVLCEVHLSDFFFMFRPAKLFRMMKLGSLLFVIFFFSTLHYMLLPLYVYMCCVTAFAIPLYVEHENITVIKALICSAVVANGHAVGMGAFVITCGSLVLLGVICFVVGVFFTWPLTHAATAYAYHHLVGVRGVKRDMEAMTVV